MTAETGTFTPTDEDVRAWEKALGCSTDIDGENCARHGRYVQADGVNWRCSLAVLVAEWVGAHLVWSRTMTAPTEEDVARAARELRTNRHWPRALKDARAVLATIGPIIERERRVATEAEVDRFAAELAGLRAENQRLREERDEVSASVERERRAALREFADFHRQQSASGNGNQRALSLAISCAATDYAETLEEGSRNE